MVGDETQRQIKLQSHPQANPLDALLQTKIFFCFAWMMAALFYFYEKISAVDNAVTSNFNWAVVRKGHYSP